jgi:hypothetical protein
MWTWRTVKYTRNGAVAKSILGGWTSSGEVFLTKLGPDEYIGKVRQDGKCYYHKSLAKDDYIGKITEMTSLAHGGAGYLLLILPKIEYVEEKPLKKHNTKRPRKSWTTTWMD